MKWKTILALGFACACGAAYPTGVGRAEDLPVIAVNREIGLAVTGSLTNYKEKLPYSGSATGHDRELGWTPGFLASSSIMFKAFNIEHLYASIQFGFGDGDVAYKGSREVVSSGPGLQNQLAVRRTIQPFNTTSSDMTTDTRGEIGKGFLLTRDFLVTSVIQGGYHSWNRHLEGADNEEDYGNFFVGIAIHADYAITPHLVIRGRTGWAETIGSRMSASDLGGHSFHLRSKPVWRGGLGADYRLTRAIHLTAGAEYSYFSYGRSQSIRDGADQANAYEPSSWTSGLQMRAGLAYGF